MSKFFSLLVCVLTLAANVALAQVPGDLGSRFARATITENAKPLLMGTIFKDIADNLVVMGAPLVDVIARAYGVQPYQVVGAPEWVYQAHLYDIEAVPPPAALIKADDTQMLRSLLADRFGLRMYRGAQEVTMLVLDADLAQQHALAMGAIPGQILMNVLRRPPVVLVGGPGAYYFSRRMPVLNAAQVSNMPVATNLLIGSLFRGRVPVLDLTDLRNVYLINVSGVRATPLNMPLMAEAIARSGLTLERRTVRINVMAVTAIERPRLDIVDR
jgi:uncharacterized protein (TIGR03435 family)